MTKTMALNIELRRWQCLLLVIPLVSYCMGGILGAFGQIAQDIAITVVFVLVVASFFASAPYFKSFIQCGGVSRLVGTWLGRGLRDTRAASSDARGDSLAMAVNCAQIMEDDTVRLYEFARCAAEDVIRARALRVEAEIALMRYKVTELQYSYRR